MMKFKKHKYSVTAISKFGDSGEMRRGFIITATPINKEQALQICKILQRTAPLKNILK